MTMTMTMTKNKIQNRSLSVLKSRGGVSLVEQDTIELCFLAYLKFMIKFLRKKNKFFTFILYTFLVRTIQYIFQNLFFFAHEGIKKRPQKLLIIGPIFFSIANRPKTSTNLNFCSMKIAHRVTYVYTVS